MAKPNLMKPKGYKGKVEKGSSMWFEHIRSEIERKRDVLINFWPYTWNYKNTII